MIIANPLKKSRKFNNREFNVKQKMHTIVSPS